MKKLFKESDEVLYFKESPSFLSYENLIDLKKNIIKTNQKKIRICSHLKKDDFLHEMFIIHHKSCYIRPHRHISKSESIFIIEGEVDLILFDELGNIKDVIEMGDPLSKKLIYNRLNESIFHTLLIKSEYIIFHEVTEGPFDKFKTEYAKWAPADDGPRAECYVHDTILKVNNFKSNINES